MSDFKNGGEDGAALPPVRHRQTRWRLLDFRVQFGNSPGRRGGAPDILLLAKLQWGSLD
jgi:hypothetical protein